MVLCKVDSNYAQFVMHNLLRNRHTVIPKAFRSHPAWKKNKKRKNK